MTAGHQPPVTLTRLATSVAMAAAAGGLVLVGAGPAAAAPVIHGSAAAACTDTWVGGAPKVLWTDARNWSTGHVPGPASNVCMSAFAIVTANGPIRVHSLQVGEQMTVVFAGTASHPSRVTIATSLDNLGNVELDNSSLTAPQADNAGGLESEGTSVLTSPAFHNGGDVVALSGSLTLPGSLAQLSNGTLSSGSWSALDDGLLVLPGDITHLVGGQVGIGQNSAIDDPGGHSALTGLQYIGPQATLSLTAGTLSLTGSLISDGTLDVGGYDSAATLAVAGMLTQFHGSLALLNQSVVSASTVRIDRGASLSADGTIDGSLVNDGSVGPAYHLSVTGSYTQTAGATLAAGFVPELQVGGKATLAGELIAGEAPPPTPGTRGTAITFSSLSGGFTSHNLGFTLVTRPHQIDVVAQPQIAASPSSVAPGGSVTVSGGDFGLGSSVSVSLGKAAGATLGTARAGDQGDFAVAVTLPSSTPAGTQHLVAVGSDGRQAEVTITVS